MRNQKQEILNLLKSHPNEWIPVYEIAKIALQYNTRLLELRRQGYVIENKLMEVVNGSRHTAFRLVEKEPTPAFTEIKGQFCFIG